MTTLWQRWRHGVRLLQQRRDWSRFAGADWAERIMAVAVTDRFHAKQGRSTGRWILQTEGQQLSVYLKRHYRLPRWAGLLATFWPGRGWSPALQEWRHLQWARAQGLPVPASVAAGEYIGPWGRLQSVLAVEELVDMLPLHEAIPMAAAHLEPRLFRAWKRGLIEELARLARELHGQRRFHKDFYLCHFYIPRETCASPQAELGREATFWRGNVHLIDLHRLGHHPWFWRRWQVKDLGQLLYSSDIVGVDARDRLHFWRCYLGTERRQWNEHWLRRAILVQWRSYRRHNAKRKRRTSQLITTH
jgi:heptose I phosphotransferase